MQLDTLVGDLKPMAIKIGMLGSKELAVEVGRFLKGLLLVGDGDGDGDERVFVVLDPVMIATSGARLIEDEAKEAMIEHLFPLVDIITPNKFEAEELLGRTLDTPLEVQQGAQDIIDMGVKAVIIKGGYTLLTDNKNNNNKDENSNKATNNNEDDVNQVIGHAQDYFLSKQDQGPPSSTIDADNNNNTKGNERMCDGSRGLWLRSHRYDTVNTHGTGCTLSSAIASALAIGRQQRQLATDAGRYVNCCSGTNMAIRTVDACCIAKEYVTAGVARGVQLGKGPGPVVHTSFATSNKYFPSVPLDPSIPDIHVKPFLPMRRRRGATASHNTNTIDIDTTIDDDGIPTMGKILPIVENFEWVERLCQTKGITDIQLRIKPSNTTSNPDDGDEISQIIERCQTVCAKTGVRLWINDYWKQAIQAGCFGVHLGQEDLARCILHNNDTNNGSSIVGGGGGLDAIRTANLALGISTHSYAELSVAMGLKPSYISLGPIYLTRSKNVDFEPQGVATVEIWRRLMGLLIDDGTGGCGGGAEEIPLVVIGGIGNGEKVGEVRRAGADCVAVIGAVTGTEDLEGVVSELTLAME